MYIFGIKYGVMILYLCNAQNTVFACDILLLLFVTVTKCTYVLISVVE